MQVLCFTFNVKSIGTYVGFARVNYFTLYEITENQTKKQALNSCLHSRTVTTALEIKVQEYCKNSKYS